ncbi:DUF4254 domain-containing protein [Nocardia sp. NPDC052566]|uniref:DUF4254 domain-containing protein n=1 Tax=Nocardia sp. NPDC052566 TaxID=3364330 RepID=UPI0037C6285C
MIPDKDELLAACRGLPPLDTDNPMLDAAGELTGLHEALEITPASKSETLEWRRVRLVRQIDEWVNHALPQPFPNASIHTETVGNVVDRLAALTFQTYVALAQAPDALYEDAWTRLADLAVGYQDLIDQLRTGVRRLPGPHPHLW